MAKTNRNRPENAPSSDATTTLMDFERRFPDDASCLDELVRMLYPFGIYCPTCGKITKHHRIKARPAYSCQFCGHMEYPMKGTIFEGSSTSLKLWFYAMYLMASTRCGISAKQLEREVGVSYPTALRMFRRLRSLLTQDEEPFGGTVEADETYIGGQGKWKHKQGPKARDHRADAFSSKSMVLGVAQRGTGQVSATVIDPARDGQPILKRVTDRVLPASVVFTDEAGAYWPLGRQGYTHSRVNHQAHIYVSGDVHTNTIEGFWSLVKRGISGTYHNVSAKYLQMYLDEYAFRYNHREQPGGMFEAMLRRVAKSDV